ncbi:MAG: hypothetical protein IKQ35_04450 [Bacilli bacterium]|nr:hypothetical protein [Bacilli bacterium]
MNKKIIIYILILFGLTGCVKNNINMKLETNNSFNITIINGVQTTDKSIKFSEEDKQKYIDNGYRLEDYSEDDYTGVKVIFDVDNINSISDSNVGVVDLTTEFEKKTSDIKLFNIKKVENGTLYTANFTYNLTSDDVNSYASNTNVGDVSAYQSMMDLKYSITLPVSVEESNATEIDGNTYSWNLEFGKINEIKFSFIINDANITKEKQEYDKKENKKKTKNTQVKNKELTAENIFSSFFGIIVLVGVIVLYYSLKKNISKKLSKKTNKKRKWSHYEAPDSIKEKK